MERSLIVEALAERFGEQPVVIGLSSIDEMMEIFASENGTWSLVMTRADGWSCLIIAGRAFDLLPPKEVLTNGEGEPL